MLKARLSGGGSFHACKLMEASLDICRAFHAATTGPHAVNFNACD